MESLIVDDERRAREELKLMLQNLGVKGTVREASSADEAMECLKEKAPDVIFLDIQMPGCDGLRLLERLGASRPVIFTTAHEQFAAKAFEMAPVDYLLKPFDPERLAKAISRLPDMEEADNRLGTGDVMLLKIDGECELLPVDEIELIEATDDGTAVRWGKSAGIVNRTVRQLEDRLDPSMFFRCSREALLNIRAIAETHLDDKGILRARLRGGRTVHFSRRQSALFKKQFRV